MSKVLIIDYCKDCKYTDGRICTHPAVGAKPIVWEASEENFLAGWCPLPDAFLKGDVGTKVYIVERHGVFMQGVYGIFDSFKLAEEALIEARRKEEDGYHRFCISTRELNRRGYEDQSSVGYGWKDV